MVEMRVGQQQDIDRLRIEAERRGVLGVELAAALEHAAIDQHALAGNLDEMTRTGDVAIRAVERESHSRSLCHIPPCPSPESVGQFAGWASPRFR
ncbi:MAG: hypothetical protein ACREEL_07965 [Stellaceae bacterium]